MSPVGLDREPKKKRKKHPKPNIFPASEGDHRRPAGAAEPAEASCQRACLLSPGGAPRSGPCWFLLLGWGPQAQDGALVWEPVSLGFIPRWTSYSLCGLVLSLPICKTGRSQGLSRDGCEDEMPETSQSPEIAPPCSKTARKVAVTMEEHARLLAWV